MLFFIHAGVGGHCIYRDRGCLAWGRGGRGLARESGDHGWTLNYRSVASRVTVWRTARR